MADGADQAGAGFGSNALTELRIKRPEQKALEEVASALGGDARLVNDVVMFVQLNGPAQAKILEGWHS
jgi:hypothetical protein